MRNNEFTMTSYERQSLALLERIADTLDVINERITSLEEAIDDNTDAKEGVDTTPKETAFPLTPVTRGQIYYGSGGNTNVTLGTNITPFINGIQGLVSGLASDGNTTMLRGNVKDESNRKPKSDD